MTGGAGQVAQLDARLGLVGQCCVAQPVWCGSAESGYLWRRLIAGLLFQAVGRLRESFAYQPVQLVMPEASFAIQGAQHPATLAWLWICRQLQRQAPFVQQDQHVLRHRDACALTALPRHAPPPAPFPLKEVAHFGICHFTDPWSQQVGKTEYHAPPLPEKVLAWAGLFIQGAQQPVPEPLPEWALEITLDAGLAVIESAALVAHQTKRVVCQPSCLHQPGEHALQDNQALASAGRRQRPAKR